MNQTELARVLRKAETEYGLVEILHQVFGKNIKINVGFLKFFCDTNIEELSLSVRSYNALRRSGVKTLGDLIDRFNEGRIKSVRNLGTKSYSEIQTRILVYGYEHLSEKEKVEFFCNLLKNNIVG